MISKKKARNTLKIFGKKLKEEIYYKFSIICRIYNIFKIKKNRIL